MALEKTTKNVSTSHFLYSLISLLKNYLRLLIKQKSTVGEGEERGGSFEAF